MKVSSNEHLNTGKLDDTYLRAFEVRFPVADVKVPLLAVAVTNDGQRCVHQDLEWAVPVTLNLIYTKKHALPISWVFTFEGLPPFLAGPVFLKNHRVLNSMAFSSSSPPTPTPRWWRPSWWPSHWSRAGRPGRWCQTRPRPPPAWWGRCQLWSWGQKDCHRSRDGWQCARSKNMT